MLALLSLFMITYITSIKVSIQNCTLWSTQSNSNSWRDSKSTWPANGTEGGCHIERGITHWHKLVHNGILSLKIHMCTHCPTFMHCPLAPYYKNGVFKCTSEVVLASWGLGKLGLHSILYKSHKPAQYSERTVRVNYISIHIGGGFCLVGLKRSRWFNIWWGVNLIFPFQSLLQPHCIWLALSARKLNASLVSRPLSQKKKEEERAW